MANRILVKKSSVAAKVPLSTDLDFGELALNYSDGKLYYKKSDGTTIDYFSTGAGTVTSVNGTGTVNGLSLAGTVTTSGSLTLAGTLDLSSPPDIGGTTAAAGTFTTLTATGQVNFNSASGQTAFLARLNTNGQTTGYTEFTVTDGTRFSEFGLAVTSTASYGNTNEAYFRGSGSTVGTVISSASATTPRIRFITGSAASSSEQLRVTDTASAVNYVQVTGAATGSSVVVSSQGSDTNIGMIYNFKGTASHSFNGNNGTHFQITSVASGANFLRATGSAASSAPVLSTQGSDTNISLAVQSKGTGAIDLAAGSSGVNISNGGTVTAITRIAGGSNYNSAVPTITISAPTTAGGVQATATCAITLNSVTVSSGGTGYTVGDTLTVVGGTGTAVVLTVSTVSSGVVTAVTISNFGIYSVAPSNPMTVTGGTGTGATFTPNFGVQQSITITNAGSGYVEQPTVTFSGGGGSGAAAYASVGSNVTVRGLAGNVFFATSGGANFQVSDSGQNAPTAIAFATGGSTSAGFGVTGSVTNASLSFTSRGTGNADFFTNTYGSLGLRVSHTASAVNCIQVTGAATGGSPALSVQGSDSSIEILYVAKGGRDHRFWSGASSEQFRVIHSAGTIVNQSTVTGSATGIVPIFGVRGSDANISLAVQSKGTGAIDLAAGSSGVNISNGGTVTAITRTATGSGYTSLPTAAISAPTTVGGVQATASPNMFVSSVSVASGGTGYTAGDVLSLVGGTGAAAQVTVATVSGGVITSITNGPNNGLYSVLPSTPVTVTGGTGTGATINIVQYGVSTLSITNAGSGYVEQPTVTFSGGGGSGAAAYATVGTNTTIRSTGNSLSLNVPEGPGFVVSGSNSAGGAYWQAFATASSPVLRAISSISGQIHTASAVPLQFITNAGSSGAEQLRVAHTASTVNYVQVTGSATGGRVTLSAQGSDASVGMAYNAKGSQSHVFSTNSGNVQFVVNSRATAVNWAQATGNIAGSPPAFSVEGSDTNIDLTLTPKGTGRVLVSSPIQIDTHLVIDAVTATTAATTANQVIMSLDATIYRAVKFLIRAVDVTSGKYHTTELLAIHNGTTANCTEYGAINIGGICATFDVDYSASTVRLLTTPASANSTVFTVAAQLLK